MPKLVERLEECVAYSKKNLTRSIERFLQYGDNYIITTYRKLAVADYLSSRDPIIFRSHMRLASEYQIKLFERFEASGEEITQGSFTGLVSDLEVWNALATCDFELTKKLMGHVYKNNSGVIDHPNPRFYHYMHRTLILGVPVPNNFFEEITVIFAKKFKSFTGYPKAFKAILNKDIPAFEEAFTEIMKGHKVLCRSGSYFGDSVDEIIAIWPLGMINLAKFHGMDVRIAHPLIPKDLICAV